MADEEKLYAATVSYGTRMLMAVHASSRDEARRKILEAFEDIEFRHDDAETRIENLHIVRPEEDDNA